MCKKAEEFILSDRRMEVSRIDKEMDISAGSGWKIIYEELGISKVSGKWVSTMLTPCQKATWLHCCEENLEILREVQDNLFLWWLEARRGSATEILSPKWVNAMKALKTEKHAGKFLPAVFWRCWRTFASGIHATQDSYNRRELCQHDDSFAGVNRRENTSQQACSFFTTVRASVDRSRQSQTAIRECGFQQLRYPPYSPHMAPSNYFLSRVLKKSWRARHFSTKTSRRSCCLLTWGSHTRFLSFLGLKLLQEKWM